MKIETRILLSCAWLAVAVLMGCGTQIPPEPPGSGGPPAPVPMDASAPDAGSGADVAPAEPSDSTAEQPAMPEPAVGPEGASPGQAEPAPAEPPADMERVKAERGVGVKGRSLDEHQGMLVTPAKAYFSVRERAVFDIQVPEALKLFKATHGNGPRSHDEFMAQIIEANQIQLPELAAGQRYVYDPEKEELQVERPAR